MDWRTQGSMKREIIDKMGIRRWKRMSIGTDGRFNQRPNHDPSAVSNIQAARKMPTNSSFPYSRTRLSRNNPTWMRIEDDPRSRKEIFCPLLNWCCIL
jgi:hypothetical protein